MKKFFLIVFSLLLGCMMQAQDVSFTQSVAMQGSLSSGQTPLWLNANKYGLSALTQANGYLSYEAIGVKQYNKFALRAGAQLAAPLGYRYQSVNDHYTSHLIVQEAYFDATYKNIYLSIGAKERPLTLRDDQLSSGSQTFGKNARPIPQVRLGLRDFWSIPGLKGWVAIKGHLSFGLMTDGEWEASFASGTNNKYNRMTRYHEKAGYLQIKKDQRPLSAILGLEMASQFGGKVYNWIAPGTDEPANYKHLSNLTSYKNALFCTTSGDLGETLFQNNEGNLLGSWVARFDWKARNWNAGLYLDHFFEDHSSMFFLDYNGYGTGSEWDKKKEHRMFVYNPSDFQFGIDLTLKQTRWVRKVVFEYLNTTYQSGPIYHDHNQTLPDHVCGLDNYYNHSSLPGWQHWGQMIGNPLYRAALYNENGYLGTQANRFRAFHLGINGTPHPLLSYRCLLSYQKNWGTYYDPFIYPKEAANLLIEMTGPLTFDCLEQPVLLTIAYGQDWGKLFGNNQGLQVTIKYVIR